MSSQPIAPEVEVGVERLFTERELVYALVADATARRPSRTAGLGQVAQIQASWLCVFAFPGSNSDARR